MYSPIEYYFHRFGTKKRTLVATKSIFLPFGINIRGKLTMYQQTAGQTRPYSVTLISILAATFVMPVMNASAQELEEIVVTAQHREQNLQDVDIAITVFSGEQMRELNWLNSTQVPDQVPNVQLVQPNSRQSYGFSVRGVLQVDFADHQEHPTAVYLDEAYISQASGAGFQLFDLDRVGLFKIKFSK